MNPLVRVLRDITACSSAKRPITSRHLLPLVLLATFAGGCQQYATGDEEKDPGPADDTGSPDADADGYTVAEGDCDDGDASLSPAAPETCDRRDNDCDGEVDEGVLLTFHADTDADGFGDPAASSVACDASPGWVEDATDCDDTLDTVFPGAPETCNEVDDDCDGDIDEDAALVVYADADGDGYGVGEARSTCAIEAGYSETGNDCDDSDPGSFPGGEEQCDERDNDCDGLVDEDVTTLYYIDVDGDGYGGDATETACTTPFGYADVDGDCDDLDETIAPGAAEYCDGIDQDCDGTIDEDDASDALAWYADADGDGYGDPGTETWACEAPSGHVSDDSDCDDGDASISPDTTWYIDYDGDGYGSIDFSLTQCVQPAGYLADTSDCDDTEAAVNPASAEVCNDVDDDCDGLVDDDDPGVDLTTASTWYTDADGDGWGDAANASISCDATGSDVSDATDCDDSDASIHPGAAEEWFDGVDSDCDGFEDPDACVDDPPAGTVAIDGTCTWAPVVGSMNPVEEWAVTSFATETGHQHVIMTPVVGQLTDDDGDGELDDDDTPDIAFVAHNRSTSSSAGVLRVLSGAGGAEELVVYGATYGGNTYYPYRYTNLALGDIDADGQPEIVATLYRSSDCYLGAYELDGTIAWVNTTDHGCRSHAPALADLEGDGDVEVIFGRHIINGADGSEQAEGNDARGYYSSYGNGGYMSFATDLDGDGQQEVIAGSSVYDATGAELCDTGTTDGYPGVADLDGDGLGELVVVAGGTIRVFEDDCTQIDSWSVYGGGYGGPPTIADFDGDGVPEVGLPGDDYYSVYEVDGTRLWAKAIDDSSSHSTGSAVFDFDGDGAAEVVYADESALWVFDGATGTVLFEDTTHASTTVNEYPVIADVDGDGNAEIVLGHNYGASGVTVIGDADDNWVSARTVWNQHAYNIVNIDDDLTIPTTPDANWPDYNSFRQGAPGSFNPTDAPNVYPVVYAACQESCGDDVTLYVQVANDGLVRASSTTGMALYGEDSGGARTELASTTLGSNLDAGDLRAPWVVSLAASELVGWARVVVMVDVAEEANECDEADNEAEVDVSAVCE
ncbi:MAG: hypothetical protein FJ090_17500 [Deltaproteobacteria bacterium]|nr:hypothetical protein [Deltaproteobacteria bacterium]